MAHPVIERTKKITAMAKIGAGKSDPSWSRPSWMPAINNCATNAMMAATSPSRSRSSSPDHGRGGSDASRPETGGECTGSDEAITMWHPAPRHRLSEKCKFRAEQ